MTGRLDESWRQRAACRGSAVPHIFHPDRDSHGWQRGMYAEALAVCGRCPVKSDCLEYAMDAEGPTHYRYGVWGGLTPRERRQLDRRRALGVAS